MQKTKLNRKAILALADDLVANKKRYDQNDFGRVEPCGTFCCLAGFVYLRQIGIRKFNKMARTESSHLMVNCEIAGVNGLGMQGWGEDRLKVDSPQIFSSIVNWPYDLVEEYRSNGPTWRVITALKALQRTDVNGNISDDPKVVYTRIPQLAQLLKSAAAKKAQAVG